MKASLISLQERQKMFWGFLNFLVRVGQCSVFVFWRIVGVGYKLGVVTSANTSQQQKQASIKKSKWGTKQGHFASPLHSPFTIICAIICVFSYLFMPFLCKQEHQPSFNKIQMCPCSCINGRQPLQSNNMKQDFWSDIQHLLNSPLVFKGDRAVLRKEKSQKVWKLATWEMYVQFMCKLFRMVPQKKQFNWIDSGIQTAQIKSMKGELIHLCKRTQKNIQIITLMLKSMHRTWQLRYPLYPGQGPFKYHSVSVNVRKFYWVRWNTILFTIKTGCVGQ